MLQTAKARLDSVLSVKEFIYSTLSYSPSNTSGITGGTISATDITPPTSNISGDINDFFGNLSSAFDMFAQVVNLVYLSPALDESDVTFHEIVNTMMSIHRFQREPITQYLATLQRSQWYNDLKPFRHCKTHRKIIQFLVVMKQSPLQTSLWPTVTTILLPDNPYSNQPTYQKNREMQVFGMNIFEMSLNAIDHMFGLIEAKIQTADRIPV